VKKKIAILGATGSIGRSTLDLVERAPERFEVVALTARRNVSELANAALRTGARLAVIADPNCLTQLSTLLDGSGCKAAAGSDALIAAAAGEADWVMAAIVGCAGLLPTMAAAEAGKTVALANKEALVTAGGLMTDAAKRSGATLLPVDSEHNAIFQCLAGSRSDEIARLVLTASGVRQCFDVASGIERQLGDVAHEVLELVVAGDEVRLRIDLDCGAASALDGNADEPFGGRASGLLGGGGKALGAQPIDSGLHVTVGFGQRLLAIHHSGAGALPQFLDGRGGNFSHLYLPSAKPVRIEHSRDA
jgi:hypothetical protein